MKLIEAEKAKDVIHEYFKSLMVNDASGADVYKLAVGIVSCLEHDANLLKAIDELPSAEPDTTTHGSNVVKKGINDGDRTSGDCISRQQAVEAVVGCTNCGTEDVLRAYATKHSLENGWTGGIVDALDAIEQLPPAEPEPCENVVSRNAIVQKLNTMDRYVSTELRLCDTDKKFPQNEVFIVDDVYEEIVEQLPSAQPETCEGCKHLGKWENEVEYGYPSPCTRCKRRVNDNYER